MFMHKTSVAWRSLAPVNARDTLNELHIYHLGIDFIPAQAQDYLWDRLTNFIYYSAFLLLMRLKGIQPKSKKREATAECRLGYFGDIPKGISRYTI